MKLNFSTFNTLGLALLLAACGGGGDSAAPADTGPQNVTLRFAAVAGSGNTPVNCGTTLTGVGTTAASAQLTDLRFYVTDVELINDQGVAVPVTLTVNASTRSWQQVDGTENVTLIDLENGQFACATDGTPETNATVQGTVPAGRYVKVRATVGVPERMSHSHVMMAAAPLDIMAMGWSWQNGRKFMKVELNPVGGVSTPSGGGSSVVGTYNLHLASTDCSGPGDGTDTCAKKNLARFTLDLDPATQQIALDVAALFASNDIRTNQNDAVGCMSATTDLDCPGVFTKVGLDIGTGASAGTQGVFRAIAQ